jgi:CheY-like chemotaxis protein/anti-sigma regulatory factor (Ser/Thr protein kinase)
MSRILVVDDDPLVLNLITQILSNEGHATLTASSAEKALAILRPGTVDLLITDFRMPGIDGMQFLEILRSSPAPLRDQRCIMITAFGTPELVLSALRKRICALLIKPFSNHELLSAVTAALASPEPCDIQVLSASPKWLEFQIPCKLGAVPTLEKLLARLGADLQREILDAIAVAFTEMLNNAIEHGGNLDPTQYVSLCCLRLNRAIIYWIKDPGRGFQMPGLHHSMASSPDQDYLRLALHREEAGLRPGGLGILLTKHMVDELVYNEQGNEVLFIKYLP